MGKIIAGIIKDSLVEGAYKMYISLRDKADFYDTAIELDQNIDKSLDGLMIKCEIDLFIKQYEEMKRHEKM